MRDRGPHAVPLCIALCYLPQAFDMVRKGPKELKQHR